MSYFSYLVLSAYAVAGAGNFVAQYFGSHLWSVAAERTYFQAVPVLLIFLFRWLDEKTS